MRWPLVSRKRFEEAEAVAFSLQSIVHDLKSEISRLNTAKAFLSGSNAGLLTLNAELEAKLKLAQKNDHRDKKGKFTKAE